jgi:uncharacterized membrane protein YeaQ/YmgE (transglycosylase-associated protein family)
VRTAPIVHGCWTAGGASLQALGAVVIGAVAGWLASFALRSSTRREAAPLVVAGVVGAVLGLLVFRLLGWEAVGSIVGWMALAGAASAILLAEWLKLLFGSAGD